LTPGCQKFKRVIGWLGGNYEAVVFWNSRERFWFTLDWADNGVSYWCPFGRQDPHSTHMLSIAVQCNPPLKGVNHRCAGAFLTDGREIYLAHSGKIAGGRKGIGKTAFVNSYPQGNWRDVQWPDGQESEMIVIGRVDGQRLPAHIDQFVRQVEKFKKVTSKGKQPKATIPPKSTYLPEFGGRKRGYRVAGDIESDCDHGLVVNALADYLKEAGFGKVGNDRARDLYVLAKNGKLRLLFEAKTNLSTSSIYQGIGQLVYHSTLTPSARRLLVLPGVTNAKTRAVLDAIGIEVVTYRLDGARPVFKNLKEVLS